MIRDAGDRLEVTGALTLDSARGLLESGASQLRQGETVFDLAAVSDIDSSGLAVIFGWQRAASQAGGTMRIANPPQNLVSLATLYGVSDLLPL